MIDFCKDGVHLIGIQELGSKKVKGSQEKHLQALLFLSGTFVTMIRIVIYTRTVYICMGV